MKVVQVSHLKAARDRPEGFILNDLKGFEIGGADIGVPNWSCISKNRFDKGIEGEEGFFLVPPGRSGEGFDYVQAF